MAVVVTLTYTNPQGAEFARCLGIDLRIGRDATQAEVKAWINDQGAALVRRVRKAEAEAAAVSFDMTAT